MSNEEKKPKDWFSRRHETREAHDQAVEHFHNRADDRPAQEWDQRTRSWVKV